MPCPRNVHCQNIPKIQCSILFRKWPRPKPSLSTIVKAYEKKEVADGIDLLSRIDRLLDRAEDIFQRNYAKETCMGDTLALKALAEQRNTLELLVKISQALHEARLLELQTSREHFEKEQEVDCQKKLKGSPLMNSSYSQSYNGKCSLVGMR